MSKYKFDGRYLKYNSVIIANINGDKIREGSGCKTIANISGDRIREGSGSKTLINLRGEDIREGTGVRRIAKMDDVRKAIDGPGGITLAALWYLFVR
jgi:hypothetical protein